MKIRPRRANTLMLRHRRNHSPSIRRADAYYGFVTRQKYGRRPVKYYWHKAKEPLTLPKLSQVIELLSNYEVVTDRLIIGGIME